MTRGSDELRDELATEPALAWRADLPVLDPARLHDRWLHTARSRQWLAVLLAAVASGPFAVVAALVENSTAGFGLVVVVVVLAPVVEEYLKGAGSLWLAEQRPWLVPTALVLPVVTVLSGLCFAALENWWYLVVLIDDPSDALVRWRWIGGPLVHGTGSLLVGLGAVRMWRRAMARGRTDFSDAVPFLTAAAILHGAFNLTAVLLSLAGAAPGG